MSHKRRFVRLTLFASALLFLAVSATLLYLCHMQAQIIAHPPRIAVEVNPDAMGISNWRTVSFAAEDGVQIEAWYIAPDERGASMVFVHGHGGNRSAVDELQFFAQNGYGVLALDLRNSGASEGNATSMGYWEALDVEAAYAFLAAQPEVDPQRIALYGVSMGGASVVRAATQLPNAAALIIESSYASLVSLIGDRVQTQTGLPPFPFAEIIVWLTGRESGGDLFDVNSEVALAQIRVPVLIMHGTADGTIPVAHAQRLYAAANEPRELWIVEGAGHGGLIYADPQGFAAHVLPFLERLRG